MVRCEGAIIIIMREGGGRVWGLLEEGVGFLVGQEGEVLLGVGLQVVLGVVVAGEEEGGEGG